VAGLADPAAARHDPAALAAAGRRIAAIDPNRAGIGGLRFQLELALFRATGDGQAVAVRAARVAPARGPVQVQPSEPPRGDPSTGAPPSSDAAEPEPSPAKSPGSIPAASGHDRGTPDDTAKPAKAGSTPTVKAAPTPAAPTPAAPTPAAAPSAASAPAAAPPAAPAPAATARLTAPASPPAGPELDELLAAWPAIVAHLSAHPPTKPLVIACRPVAVEGNIVTLGFPEEQAFLKDAAERRKAAIEAGIGAVLGRPVGVRCVVANVEVAATGPADSAYVLAEARRIFADDIVDVGEVS